ncbi:MULTISPECIES: hypothetical protein [Sphingomonas]|uniref:Lipoprotein n=1 Tax=Sphingomonas kyungheensis TaxID=1069987 RepID=A0ABU8GXT3_9SPHN|nr:hypothetical protein [Sphingomonas sp. CV7422]
MRIVLAAALALAAAACVPQPVPPPAPAPSPVAALPAPPVSAPPPRGNDWRDWPLTPGDWTWARDARGSIARFGVPGGAIRLALRCDAAQRRILLSVEGATATTLTVRTTSVTRAVPVQPAGGNPPALQAALAADDGLLDAMGFSRGRFVIEHRGGATLVVPAWAEIERVTEDCRG